MASISRLTILGCVAAVARAQFVKRGTETERWEPARETDGIMNLDPMGWTPKPTSAPEANAVEKELRKRDGTSTCGYYSGYSSSAAVVCQGSAQCIVNDWDAVMGCCASADINDCNIYTSCLPSRSAASFSGTYSDYTLFCTESDYPNCVTYSYDSYDPLYAGYSALGCGYAAGVYSVEYYAPILGSALTGSSTTRTTHTSSKTRSSATSGDDSLPGSTSASSSSMSTTSSGSTSTSTAAAAASSSSGGSTGAIVGGVVGGIAGLGLLALGIFFLIRQHNKNKQQQQPPPPAQNNGYFPPPQQPSPGPHDSMYGSGQQMAQASPQQFAGYPQAAYMPGQDPRASMAPSTYYDPHSPKPSQYDSMMTGSVSPTGSPPPPAHTPPLAAGVHQPQQYQAYNPAQAGQYAHYNQPYGQVAELPASRPDGELRELA
ncbi:hypothetical protein PFICI_07648 [Pestalotiopsis fici W106-1]|uniref:Mid2 domain-containing protein n=1 Tax=Pestalotiopsis fici (strain W106-1 / CGMCC3.15140) TaxID=1229662 RepID=W3X272_PESFW|nr:uncharacterized protein PFICI_07648 [Pestalotiopsis fici W106-1]ETS80119.1 hypothetical protein PFICI_07648 [Pestalotiopsis fici W106-1]